MAHQQYVYNIINYYLAIKGNKMEGQRYSFVVHYLRSMHKALDSIPSSTKKQKKE
jgi:hypothetical protein